MDHGEKLGHQENELKNGSINVEPLGIFFFCYLYGNVDF